MAALASQLLVAFTIELDNEFERQMPHRTTKHGSTPGTGPRPWLVSMAMWAHCMRFVPEDGIPAGELARRACLSAKSAQMVLKRMSTWWGYLVVVPGARDQGVKLPPSSWVVRPSPAGAQAQRIWAPLTAVIEDRWRARFGGAAIDELQRRPGGRRQPPQRRHARLPPHRGTAPGAGGDGRRRAEPTLPALLSKVLLAFALDFEDDVRPLARGLHIGQALPPRGERQRPAGPGAARDTVADVPALTGVAKMATDNWLGALEQHRYITVGPCAGSRGKVARLTAKGGRAQDAYLQWAGTVEPQWEARFGAHAVRRLRAATERLVTEPAVQSPLWRGIEPYPDGWRAQVPRPRTLPHYPVVSPRGGFPDGS